MTEHGQQTRPGHRRTEQSRERKENTEGGHGMAERGRCGRAEDRVSIDESAEL